VEIIPKKDTRIRR